MNWSGSCARTTGGGRSGMGGNSLQFAVNKRKLAVGGREWVENTGSSRLHCQLPTANCQLIVSAYRLRRSRRALRFLLPILRRRRGLAMRRLLSLSGQKGLLMPGLMVFLVTKGRSVPGGGRFVQRRAAILSHVAPVPDSLCGRRFPAPHLCPTHDLLAVVVRPPVDV
jgi:hypothetical protein